MPVFTKSPSQMNVEEMRAYIAYLEEEKKKTQTLSFKIGAKGGCSVYGFGRFPVTLYYDQWVRLFTAKDRIMAFMEENKDKLVAKGDKPVADKPAA